MAVPTKAASDSGVSSTRWLPNCWMRPTVVRNGPPQASTMPRCSRPAPPAISSPMMITVSSRSISCRMASLMASRTCNSLVAVAVVIARSCQYPRFPSLIEKGSG